MLPRRWEYIDTVAKLREATKAIKAYILKETSSDGDAPILAIDVETFRPDGDRTKFPNAYWTGLDWEGRIRLLSVGLDTTGSF
jgi:hypothetical protein